MSFLQSLNNLTSLGFGANLGGGIGGIVYLLQTNSFDLTFLFSSILCGILIGTGLGKVVSKLLNPFNGFISYYLNIIEIVLQRKWIRQDLISKMIELQFIERFLNDSEAKKILYRELDSKNLNNRGEQSQNIKSYLKTNYEIVEQPQIEVKSKRKVK